MLPHRPITMQPRIIAALRMLIGLQARLEGGAGDLVLNAIERLKEGIADLTRLELKLRGRR